MEPTNLIAFNLTLPAARKTLIVANHMVVEIIACSGFAALLSTRHARDGYPRLKPAFDRTAAAVPGAFGLRLMRDR